MHEVLVNSLGLSLSRKSAVRLTDRLDMTIAVDWDVKLQNNNINNHLATISILYACIMYNLLRKSKG